MRLSTNEFWLWIVMQSLLMIAMGKENETSLNGCLSFDQNEFGQMHEYGGRRVSVQLQISGGCLATENETAPLQNFLIVELDGERMDELGRDLHLRRNTAPHLVRLLLPTQMRPGSHELLCMILSQDGQEVDSAIYNFLTVDWQPAVNWIFPPEGYVFKRNSQKFIKFGMFDRGDGKRCQVKKDSFVPKFLMLMLQLACKDRKEP
jgi:hypothetical protein